MSTNPIILFDGVCNLCHSSVRFVLKHDVAGRFRFASLQSEIGRALAERAGMSSEPRTMILIDGDQVFTRSTAALHIAKELRAPWKWAANFLFVPAPIRDLVYRIIARLRYTLMGRRDTCEIPSADYRDRFLDAGELAGDAA